MPLVLVDMHWNPRIDRTEERPVVDHTGQLAAVDHTGQLVVVDHTEELAVVDHIEELVAAVESRTVVPGPVGHTEQLAVAAESRTAVLGPAGHTEQLAVAGESRTAVLGPVGHTEQLVVVAAESRTAALKLVLVAAAAVAATVAGEKRKMGMIPEQPMTPSWHPEEVEGLDSTTKTYLLLYKSPFQEIRNRKNFLVIYSKCFLRRYEQLLASSRSLFLKDIVGLLRS